MWLQLLKLHAKSALTHRTVKVAYRAPPGKVVRISHSSGYCVSQCTLHLISCSVSLPHFLFPFCHYVTWYNFFSFHGANTPRGPGPRYRGFTSTLRHTTFSSTPLCEWSDLRRDLYLTTHNTHKRKNSINSAGFEPTIPACERPPGSSAWCIHNLKQSTRHHLSKPWCYLPVPPGKHPILHSAHSEFMCFVWIAKQTAILSVYSIKSGFITGTVRVYCAVQTDSLNITQVILSLNDIHTN